MNQIERLEYYQDLFVNRKTSHEDCMEAIRQIGQVYQQLSADLFSLPLIHASQRFLDKEGFTVSHRVEPQMALMKIIPVSMRTLYKILREDADPQLLEPALENISEQRFIEEARFDATEFMDCFKVLLGFGHHGVLTLLDTILRNDDPHTGVAFTRSMNMLLPHKSPIYKDWINENRQRLIEARWFKAFAVGRNVDTAIGVYKDVCQELGEAMLPLSMAAWAKNGSVIEVEKQTDFQVTLPEMGDESTRPNLTALTAFLAHYFWSDCPQYSINSAFMAGVADASTIEAAICTALESRQIHPERVVGAAKLLAEQTPELASQVFEIMYRYECFSQELLTEFAGYALSMATDVQQIGSIVSKAEWKILILRLPSGSTSNIWTMCLSKLRLESGAEPRPLTRLSRPRCSTRSAKRLWSRLLPA